MLKVSKDFLLKMKPYLGFFFVLILKKIIIPTSGISILKLSRKSEDNILRSSRTLQDLPPSELIIPGHALINPTSEMLKSASKFPSKDGNNAAVYGNPANVGVSFGNTGEYILYTGFRKTNDLTNRIIKTLKEINNKNIKEPVVIVLEKMHLSDESNNEQALENLWKDNETWEEFNLRRNRDNYKDKVVEDCKVNDESSSSASEDERNPGNPYTIFKDKYIQNWPWNFQMDGNHMNINPYGPTFAKLGPSGADLFFGRKWWYFNQDDYIPLR